VRGHPATGNIKLSPDRAGKFCKHCGGAILTACPSCNSPIRGDYEVAGVFVVRKYVPPNFCEDCGEQFPWMVEKLNAAAALADELENFTDTERAKIKELLNDVSKDGPSTEVAAIWLKKWFGTATDAVGKAFWKAAVDIATEYARKTLLG
jgi:hypothetical protein